MNIPSQDIGASKKNKILLMFKDDSSLLSAVKFEKILGHSQFDYTYCYAFNKKNKGRELSSRQISESLGERKIDYKLEVREAAQESFLEQFDTVVSCKFPLIFEIKWLLNFWSFSGKRPCFVAMFPGIEFTPKLGTKTRQFADIICLNCPEDIEKYKRFVPGYLRRQNVALQFSPFFYQHKKIEAKNQPPKKVVFFAQSIMPQSRASRLDVLRSLVEAANANPQTSFVIKLRHLEDENTAHTHLEEYSYQQFAREEFSDGLPNNLSFSAQNINSLLKECDLAVTVASTAGMEALGAGVPTVFLHHYEGSEKDLHNGSMRDFAKDSGLLGSKENLIKLTKVDPNGAWIQTHMSSKPMIKELIENILNFNRSKPIPRKPIIGKLLSSSFGSMIYWFV